MTEIWKPVPDCPDYEVSDLGRVRKKRNGAYARAFSDDEAISIRELYASGGHTTVTLAEKFQAHPTSISRLLRRKSYVHI